MATTNTRRVLFTSDAKFAVTPPENGQPATLSGYALVWNALSSDRGGYKVRLKPGSAKFAEPTEALFNHQSTGGPLGDTDSQTLILTPDDYGVKVTIKLPDTQLGRDTYTLVKDRRVRGMSFAMVEAPWAIQGWTASGPQIVPVQGAASVLTENGQTVVEVYGGFVVDEVTITSRPAFETTTIDVAKPKPTQESYAVRVAQSNQLQRLKLDLCRPAGAGFAHVASHT